jgi:hypothetical protein
VATPCRAFWLVGVGQAADDEHPVAAMGRADITSSPHSPRDIHPDFGQLRQHSSEEFAFFRAEEPWDIFQDREAWSYIAKNPGRFSPQIALIIAAAASTGRGVGLAGKAAVDNVWSRDSISAESIKGNGAHVVINRYSRPMMRQHRLAKRIDLHEGRGADPRGLGGQVEAADPTEQRERPKRH